LLRGHPPGTNSTNTTRRQENVLPAGLVGPAGAENVQSRWLAPWSSPTKGTQVMEFFQSWTFIILMIVILVGLVVLLFVLRNRREED
jgi:hypothetical protein